MLSIVVPIYNESLNIDGLFTRLMPALEKSGEPFEVICIDDGSKDDSVARLKAYNQADPRIKLLVFSRNFGKEAALSAGLANAAGNDP
jgi:glycosyltransferase involved in cell wall biosynthesis